MDPQHVGHAIQRIIDGGVFTSVITKVRKDTLTATVLSHTEIDETKIDEIRNELDLYWQKSKLKDMVWSTVFAGRILNYSRITEYPDDLTLIEFDSMPWNHSRQFMLEDYPGMDEVVDAVSRHADETGGVVYSQIDALDVIHHGHRIYTLGLETYDPIGIFEVVRIDALHPEN